jgi:hypothetical protein
MTAAALAMILLSDSLRLKRREWLACSVVLAMIVGSGLISRSTLPPAPDGYEGMIRAASG